MKHFLRTPYWQLKLPTAINGLNLRDKFAKSNLEFLSKKQLVDEYLSSSRLEKVLC